jgi:hypothetical protein
MADINNESENQTCPTVAYQLSSVCVPVTVSPFAQAGATTTKCCGNPIVTSGKNNCGGTKNGQCVFTVSQNVCIEVPVEFGATAAVGDAYVDCIEASADDICSDCANYITDTPDEF